MNKHWTGFLILISTSNIVDTRKRLVLEFCINCYIQVFTWTIMSMLRKHKYSLGEKMYHIVSTSKRAITVISRRRSNTQRVSITCYTTKLRQFLVHKAINKSVALRELCLWDFIRSIKNDRRKATTWLFMPWIRWPPDIFLSILGQFTTN